MAGYWNYNTSGGEGGYMEWLEDGATHNGPALQVTGAPVQDAFSGNWESGNMGDQPKQALPQEPTGAGHWNVVPGADGGREWVSQESNIDLDFMDRYGDLSQMWNPLQGVDGLQSLGLDAFTKDERGNWLTNMSNPFVNTTMNTAGYGKFRSGLDSFLNPSGDLFQLGGAMRGSQQSKETYKAIAAQLGIDPNDPDLINKVTQAANNFVSLEGLSGLNPNDPRQNQRTLYMNTGSEWKPVSGLNWHQREKGSYIEEHPGVLVPLSIVGGGLAAGAAAGGAGAAAGGAGAAAGASSTSLAGQLAHYLGLGGQFSSLPAWAQTGLSGAIQGAGRAALTGGDALQGALTGGIGGALNTSIGGAVKDLGLGQTATGALTGAASGGLTNLVGGKNPLTGALLGGVGGLTSGGLRDLGASGGFAGTAGGLASNLTGQFLQDQIKDEVFEGRQDVMKNIYAEAQARGISPQQLNQFLQTPQGRQAAQAIIKQQGPGTLQSLFG